jgi:hypothetical protein
VNLASFFIFLPRPRTGALSRQRSRFDVLQLIAIVADALRVIYASLFTPHQRFFRLMGVQRHA